MKHHVVTEDELKQFEANVQRIKVGGDVVSTSRVSNTPSPARAMAGSNPAPPPLTLALTGQLPSGKNQVQLSFRNGTVHKYPNKTFTNWRATAHVQLLEQVSRCATRIPTITTPVRLTVEYWPGDARTRDISGQLDALFHLLVYAKVLKDDGLVHDVTWKRQAVNRTFPKVFLTIEVMP